MTGSPYDPQAPFGGPAQPGTVAPVLSGQVIPTDLDTPVGSAAAAGSYDHNGAYDPVDRSYAPLGSGQPPAGPPQHQALQPYAPMPNHQGPTTNVYVLQAPKSVGVAFVLTFFFGPVGLFYSSVAGALVLLGITLCLGVLGGIVIGMISLATLGLGALLIAFAPLLGIPIWITSMIWGCLAAASQNGRLRAQAQQVHSQQMQAQQAAQHGYYPAF